MLEGGARPGTWTLGVDRPGLCLQRPGAQSNKSLKETDCQDFRGQGAASSWGTQMPSRQKRENGMIKGGMHLACLYFLTSPSHVHLDLVKL